MRLRVIAHTVLKQEPKQSAELADSEKLAVRVGDEFDITSYEAAEGQHIKVLLAQPLDDDNRVVWYVFQPHVELVPALEETVEAPPEPPAESAPTAESSPKAVSEDEANMVSNMGCGGAIAMLGALLILVPLVQFLNPVDKFPGRLNGWGWTALSIGVVSAGFGTWLGLDALVSGRKAKRDRIQNTFFDLLEASNGEITVLQFARTAKLSGEEAQKYLDARAKEFGAAFDVGSEGGIYYRFK